jgi:hypothetical protein
MVKGEGGDPTVLKYPYRFVLGGAVEQIRRAEESCD